MSVSQQKTAVRLAKIPAEEFEAAVESPDPPGTMRLAGRAALRPPPLSTEPDGGFERARGLLSALLVVYCSAPPEGQGHGSARVRQCRRWRRPPSAAVDALSPRTGSRIRRGRS
jgi:hypothetical protein